MSDSALDAALRKSSPRRKKKNAKYESSIVLNKTNTQYACISRNAKALGWMPVSDTFTQRSDSSMIDSTNDSVKSESSVMPTVRSGVDWNVYWTDSGLHIDKLVRTAKTYQKLNHFPGMVHIYRKSNLARSMARMSKIDNAAYEFYPKTWILPGEQNELQLYLKHNINNTRDKDRCVIVKPSGGAQGKGIYLAMHPHAIMPTDDAVAQVYVPRPLLINGFKFDLRIYALITCVDPLRILLYREGLVRLCTTQYEAPNVGNADCAFMHLTNYAVNKHNDDFVQNDGHDEDEASKRSLSWLWAWMEERNMDAYGVWQSIGDVVVKSLISIQAGLAQSYRACKVDAETRTPFTCFELLGFDILLTSTLKPVLIEVNHTPSFRTDSKLDAMVKNNLIKNTLLLLNVSAGDRQKFNLRKAALSQIRLYGNVFDRSPEMRAKLKGGIETRVTQWETYLSNERAHRGNFDLIYPVGEYANQPTSGHGETYKKLLQAAHSEYWGTNIDLVAGLSPSKDKEGNSNNNDEHEKEPVQSPSTASIATTNSTTGSVKKGKVKSPTKDEAGSSPPTRGGPPTGSGGRGSPRPKTPTNKEKEGEQAWGRNPAATSPRGAVRSRDPSPGALETVENEKVAIQGGYGQEEADRVKNVSSKPKTRAFIARQEKNAYHSRVSLVRSQEEREGGKNTGNDDKMPSGSETGEREVVIRAGNSTTVSTVSTTIFTSSSSTLSIDKDDSSCQNDTDVTDKELLSPDNREREGGDDRESSDGRDGREDSDGRGGHGSEVYTGLAPLSPPGLALLSSPGLASTHSKDSITCEDGDGNGHVGDDSDHEAEDREKRRGGGEREMTNFEKRLCKVQSVASTPSADSDGENDKDQEKEQDSSKIDAEINLYAASDSSPSFGGSMWQSLDVLPTIAHHTESNEGSDISFTYNDDNGQIERDGSGLESAPPTSWSHAISVCVDALEGLHNSIVPLEQQQQQGVKQLDGGGGATMHSSSSDLIGFGDSFSREPALRSSPRTLPNLPLQRAAARPQAPAEYVGGHKASHGSRSSSDNNNGNKDKMESLRLKYSAFREEWLNTYRSAVNQNQSNSNEQR